jgi:transposase
MPRPLVVTPHLSLSELEEQFRLCQDSVEKIHWQAIMLLVQGRRTAEVAEICGYKPDWVRRLIRRYNKHGPDGLRDRRQDNGRSCLLSDDQLAELYDAVLHGEPPGGGLWTGPKVACWMSEKLSRRISPQTAWDYLKRMGMSKQTPRPRHVRASASLQDEFKKNSVAVWQ